MEKSLQSNKTAQMLVVVYNLKWAPRNLPVLIVERFSSASQMVSSQQNNSMNKQALIKDFLMTFWKELPGVPPPFLQIWNFLGKDFGSDLP